MALGLFSWLPNAEAELVFTSEPPLEAQVGVPYSYTLAARIENTGDGGDGGSSADDGDGIAFAAQILPGWLAFDGIATIAGTPSSDDVGNHAVVIVATANEELAFQRFTIEVPAPPIPNAPPVFGGAPTHSVDEGARIDIDVGPYFSDPDGDALAFTARGMPGWLALSGSLITGTAPDDSGGTTASFIVIATDPDDASAEGTLSITIVALNAPPRLQRPIEPDPQRAFVGESYAFEAGDFFTDPDGDALTFSATGLPAGFAIASNGRVTGQPTAAHAAASPFSITVQAADPTGATASGSFTLIVEARNGAPVLDRDIEPDPQSVNAGEAYRFDASAFFSDPDGDTLTFSAAGLPPSLAVDAATGVIAGTPTDADEGTHSIRVTASDGVASVSDQYSLAVLVADEPPVLPDPPPSLSTPEDTPLTITAELLGARDEEPEALTVVLTRPSGNANFTLSGSTVTPARDFNGTLSVRASVRDAKATSNSVTVTITVTPVNDAPRIDTVPQQGANEGAPFELALGDFVTDPEGDALTFSATGLPPGLSIDAATGAVAGVPAIAAAAGVHTVRFAASDGDASAAASFELRVMEAGRADLSIAAAVSPNPVLSGAAATFTFSVTNGSSVDVGRASVEVSFTADSPFTIDGVADPACAIEPGSGTVVLRCTLAPVVAGAVHSIDAAARADQAAEIRAVANVAVADAVPIDEMPDNDSATATLVVARSLGTGAAQELGAPGARALAVGDFDGDGAADLAAATAAGQPLFIFMNRPSAENRARLAFDPTPIPVGDPLDAVDIAAADLDADGDIDLVAADAGGAHRLLLNDGAVGFASSPLAGGPQSEAVEVADVDGDALPDITFVGRGAGANVLFRNSGAGNFTSLGALLAGPAVDVLAADVLAGGPPEIVIARDAGNAAVVSVGGGSAQPVELSTGPGTSLAFGDFDGDGRVDLVLGRGTTAREADSVFLNTSAGAPRFFLAAELGRAPTVAVLSGDFDIDGRADVIAINAAGGHRLYKNSGAANLAFVLHAEQFSTVSASAAAAGQLNGDGRVDVAVAGADAIAVFLNDGRGNLGHGDETAPTLTLRGEPAITLSVGESYVDAGATASDDIDGDLTDRIVVANPVDVDVIGAYTVSYDVTDLSGNAAATLTRTVEVKAREAGGGGGGGAFGLVGLASLCTALVLCRLLKRPRAAEPFRASPQGKASCEAAIREPT